MRFAWTLLLLGLLACWANCGSVEAGSHPDWDEMAEGPEDEPDDAGCHWVCRPRHLSKRPFGALFRPRHPPHPDSDRKKRPFGPLFRPHGRRPRD
ncbi:hypothetical protein BOX15_Mlig024080g1 [Macrostomum lignano]|uniref:Uncharacterized protein n=1 Tax=Macrostomum lignano TaxID=282301 RepID=A0A267EJZ6_9PLAT|nr:hypothetical protein BOX15_Mlig024080g1 [Macrostomum lignano]